MVSRWSALLALFALRAALYEQNSKVVSLSAAALKEKVLQSGRFWLVEFYAPWCGHCQSLAPEYEKAARALEGVVTVAAVNVDEHSEAGAMFGVKGFPTIKLFGTNKSAPVDYNGERTAQAIAKFALGQVHAAVRARLGGSQQPGGAGGLQELSESSFAARVTPQESWMVMFYAPWCGHCKSAMPHFEAAARQAQGAKFGRVNCEENRGLCAQHDVRGYPTIRFFSGGGSEPYEGARSQQAFAEFAASRARPAPPKLELARLADQRLFDTYCAEFDGICLIAFLPDVRDSSEEKRAQYLKDLASVREANARSQLSFLWAQGGEQLQFEESLNLKFGYPAMLAIHHRKRKYAIMRRQFDRENIEKFIGDFFTGSAAVYDLPQLPAIRPAARPKPAEEL